MEKALGTRIPKHNQQTIIGCIKIWQLAHVFAMIPKGGRPGVHVKQSTRTQASYRYLY